MIARARIVLFWTATAFSCVACWFAAIGILSPRLWFLVTACLVAALVALLTWIALAPLEKRK